MLFRGVAGRSLVELARLSFGMGRRAAALAEKVNASPESPVFHSRNQRFKDSHLGRRAFVMGKGPSSGKQDISAVTGDLVFTMHSFNRHPLCRQLRAVDHFPTDSVVGERAEFQWPRSS